MKSNTKKLTTIAMLCAVSYMLMLVSKVLPPMVLFLQYDPKDIVITLGGFIYGPLSAALISLVVSLIEFVTVSDTGVIGLIMNVISTCAFSCVASMIYKYKRTLPVAVCGLVFGTLISTAVMLLWNYFITPFYMGIPREAVAKMLVPAFLPFNLIKGGLNTAFLLLIYKPVVSGLRRAKLIAPSVQEKSGGRGHLLFSVIAAVSLLAICVFAIVIILK